MTRFLLEKRYTDGAMVPENIQEKLEMCPKDAEVNSVKRYFFCNDFIPKTLLNIKKVIIKFTNRLVKTNLCLIWAFINYRGWRQELWTSLLESKAEFINITEENSEFRC